MQDVTLQERTATTARTVIMFAVAEGQDVTPEQMRTGTPGILLSSSDPQVLLHAIREMGKGNLPNDGSIAQRVMLQVTEPALQPAATPVTELSPREKEVLNALVEGLSYKMIAHRLSISFETVRTHMKRIYEKLQVHSNTEAVAKALRNGLVEYA
ncbi:MAG: response regulator transcription factor [Bacteroidetes bacterium]|nr:response regulator transcription factor [Bacteroidota bacterium]